MRVFDDRPQKLKIEKGDVIVIDYSKYHLVIEYDGEFGLLNIHTMQVSEFFSDCDDLAKSLNDSPAKCEIIPAEKSYIQIN